MKSKPEQHTTDAERHIREYYESQPPSATEVFPAPLEMATPSAQPAGRDERFDHDLPELSGGDPDVSQQGIDAGTETPGGSNPTPDQDQVDEIGMAAGVTYQDNEPLSFGDKVAERDNARWELDPTSSEDYQERQILLQEEPAPADSSESAGREKDS